MNNRTCTPQVNRLPAHSARPTSHQVVTLFAALRLDSDRALCLGVFLDDFESGTLQRELIEL